MLLVTYKQGHIAHKDSIKCIIYMNSFTSSVQEVVIIGPLHISVNLNTLYIFKREARREKKEGRKERILHIMHWYT